MISTEHVLTTTPFVVRRRVKWGECDPAGVTYTVWFSEYVISAAELFYGFLFDGSSQPTKDQYNFQTPTRALTFDFRSRLRPDDQFDMTVHVMAIRSRSYDLQIYGRTLTADDVFIAKLSPICALRGLGRAIPIPPPFRLRLEEYQRRWSGGSNP